MSFDTRAQGKRGNLVLSIAIQGIDTIFTENAIVTSPSPTSGETWPNVLACIPVDGIKQGEQLLDMDRRMVLGGGLTFSLCEPNGSTVLQDLFQPRTFRRTYLTNDMTAATTTMTVADNTWATAASGTVYCGGETLTYSSKTGSTIFTVARGKYKSIPQKHLTSTDKTAASGVYSKPPSMRGRDVYLYGVFLDDGGIFDAGTSAESRAKRKLLGVFTIDEPPSVSDGKTWNFSCSPLMSQIIKAKCYKGFKETPVFHLYPHNSGDTDYDLYVEDAQQFDTAEGLVGATSVLIKLTDESGGERPVLARIISVDIGVTPNIIVVRPEYGYFYDNDLLVYSELQSVKHIACLPYPSAYSVLSVLTSRTGSGDNGPYDTLPGEERSSGADEAWQMGCGVDERYVDPDSFIEVGNTNTGWSYIVDETETAGAVLSEWCMVTGSFCVVIDGVLTAKTISDVRDTSALTIDDSVVSASEISVSYDEGEIRPVVRVECNYSPASGDYDLRTSFVDHELKERYPFIDDSYDIKLKGLASAYPSTYESPTRFTRPAGFELSWTTFRQIVRAWQRSTSRGKLLLNMKCGIQAIALQVSQVCVVNLPQLLDLEGGTLTGATVRVIGTQPDWGDGTINLTLQVMDRVFLVTPSNIVTAVTTITLANDTLTIATGDHANYAVGMSIRLWDADSTVTSQVLTVLALHTAPSRVQFTTSISGTVEADVDWITWNTNGTNISAAPASGYTEGDYSFQMIDSLAVTTGRVRRWQ